MALPHYCAVAGCPRKTVWPGDERARRVLDLPDLCLPHRHEYDRSRFARKADGTEREKGNLWALTQTYADPHGCVSPIES